MKQRHLKGPPLGASQAWVDWTRAIGDLHAARDRHSCQHPRQWALTTGQGPGLNGRQQRCAGQLPGFECETASLRGERWSSSLADCPLAQRLTCCPDQGSPKLDGVGEQGCLEHGGLGPCSLACAPRAASHLSKNRPRSSPSFEPEIEIEIEFQVVEATEFGNGDADRGVCGRAAVKSGGKASRVQTLVVTRQRARVSTGATAFFQL
ncbi:hypothetical protein ACCO45_007984 [Purpureocillium lilacinum]|uniref:Uncharacterized protein n=1 Tax=Purpureocillium lilacinum TaxID=33203 RepID=A0ACC4DLZ7_PURLI